MLTEGCLAFCPAAFGIVLISTASLGQTILQIPQPVHRFLSKVRAYRFACKILSTFSSFSVSVLSCFMGTLSHPLGGKGAATFEE